LCQGGIRQQKQQTQQSFHGVSINRLLDGRIHALAGAYGLIEV
jgi:hypothetical protein